MKNPARTLRGNYRSDDGSVTPVRATIGKPKREKGQTDWSCIVHCPFLFSTDKKIAGVDAAQALTLAEEFLRELLEQRGVDVD